MDILVTDDNEVDIGAWTRCYGKFTVYGFSIPYPGNSQLHTELEGAKNC